MSAVWSVAFCHVVVLFVLYSNVLHSTASYGTSLQRSILLYGSPNGCHKEILVTAVWTFSSWWDASAVWFADVHSSVPPCVVMYCTAMYGTVLHRTVLYSTGVPGG